MFSVMHLHPMLVHFPIALVIFGFLAELIFLFLKREVRISKMGYYLLIVGTLTALLAWLTGNFFTSPMSGAAGRMKESHELFATITLILLLVTSILRTAILMMKIKYPILKTISFILYALASIAVSITGYLGGTLVYSYMVGI